MVKIPKTKIGYNKREHGMSLQVQYRVVTKPKGSNVAPFGL